MTRRDIIIDICYAVVIGAYVYVAVDRLTDGQFGLEIQARCSHAADWLLHNKRLNEQVAEQRPYVIWEAIQAKEQECGDIG